MAAFKLVVLCKGAPLVAAFTTRDAAITARDFFHKQGAATEVIFDGAWDYQLEDQAEGLRCGAIVKERSHA